MRLLFVAMLLAVLCCQYEAAELNVMDGGSGGIPVPIQPKEAAHGRTFYSVPPKVLDATVLRAMNDTVQERQLADIPCLANPGTTFIPLGDHASFKTPNYPNKYPNRASCGWKFKVDPQYHLSLHCLEIVLARRDYLILKDLVALENTRYDNLNVADKYFNFTGHQARILFKSNRRRNAKGFHCHIYPVDPNLTTVTTSTVSTTPISTTTTQPPSTNDCECGKSLTGNRIVGGSDADIFEYPWMVGLGDTSVYCGGALICRDWVLTAAHCISGGTIVMRLNMHDSSNLSQTIRKVSRQVIVHENYNSNTLVNDIALIRIDPVDWASDPVRPVCLPVAPYKTYVGVDAVMTGWGTLRSNGAQPDILQEVTIPVLSYTACKAAYQQYTYVSSFICAGVPQGGLDTCQGDSGGPMLYQDSGNYEQIGITSWGLGCAVAGQPGVYTRVTTHVAWINQKTGGCDTCQRSSA